MAVSSRTEHASRMRALILAATLSGLDALEPKAFPRLPRQFEACIETTAHQLELTPDQEYPPRVRQLRVYYDYPNRRARIDESQAPGVPARSSVKRYDLAFEFTVRELSGLRSCLKSRVREAMPPPLLPDSLIYLGTEKVHGILCDKWRDVRSQRDNPNPVETVDSLGDLGLEEGDEFVDLWFVAAPDTHGPLFRVRSQTVSKVVPGNQAGDKRLVVTEPLMTWEILEMSGGAPPAWQFTVAAAGGASVFNAELDSDGSHARGLEAAKSLTPPSRIVDGLNMSGCERVIKLKLYNNKIVLLALYPPPPTHRLHRVKLWTGSTSPGASEFLWTWASPISTFCTPTCTPSESASSHRENTMSLLKATTSNANDDGSVMKGHHDISNLV